MARGKHIFVCSWEGETVTYSIYKTLTICIHCRKSTVSVHSSGQRLLVAGAGSTRPQKLHDYHQHTILGVSDHIFLRWKCGDNVRMLNNDGSGSRFLGRSVFRVLRRSVWTKTQRRPDVGYERVLLQRFTAAHHHLCHHQTVEIDSTRQHGDTDHNYCDFMHGE